MDTGAGLPTPLPYRADSPYAGVPFRGPQMHMREDDPPHLQPKWNYEPHVQTFDLSDDKDIKAYLEVIFKVTKGASQIGYEDIQYNAETNSWTTLLRWYDLFLTAPTTEVNSNGDGKPVWNGS